MSEIYSGRTGDPRSARPFQGMYVSPDGNEWGNMPYTAEQQEEEKRREALEKEYNIRDEILNHIGIEGSFEDEYNLILQKKSTMSRRLRDWLVKQWELENCDEHNP